MFKKDAITVIIATKNRPLKLRACLEILLKQVYKKNRSIIIVDQSNNDKTLVLVKSFQEISKSIIYLKQHIIGKSKALNAAILRSSADILVFTDDDCVPSNNWLDTIESSFSINSDVSCVTGNTYPYMNIPSWACPPIISNRSSFIVTPLHHREVGFGNNLAIKRSAIESIGLFKSWLGPGSISSNCEDGEINLRLLLNNYKIFRVSNMVVYHNKTLNKLDLWKQNLSYSCGEMACYGYYSIRGYQFAKKVVLSNLGDSVYKVFHIIKNLLFFRWNSKLIIEVNHAFIEMGYRARGLFIG